MESIAEITTAITIAESAKLKTGQWGKRIQSITCPRKAPGCGDARKIRSVKLPRVPPRTRPKTFAQGREVKRLAQYPIAQITRIAKVERSTVPLVAMLNAAPEFFVKERERKFPRIFLGSLFSRTASAHVLLPTSNSHTSHATSRTRIQIGRSRRKISAALPSVCRSCRGLREEKLEVGPCQWDCRTLHIDHMFGCQFFRERAQSAEPYPVH